MKMDIISETITKLRQLNQVEVQDSWSYYNRDLPAGAIINIKLSDWAITSPNDKGYITWKAGGCVHWLAQKFTISQDLQGYSLTGMAVRLLLTWWAEDAKIFVNSKLVQEGDLFDSSTRILLTPSAVPGEEIVVALRLVSPGHDIGALMRSELVYETIDEDRLEPSFIANELEILQKYLATFELEKLKALATATSEINWNVVNNRREFDCSLANFRQTLQPLAANLKKRCIHLLGHAHLDLAWLWPVAETWEVAQRTFASVLNLQKDYPDLIFCHTSPALYAWVEKHRPDLFQAIQEAVKAKSWEVLGGMWVEPEVNLVSGESLVRQLLYGQHYCQEKFGAITKIAWLPDTFGFTWQLPQIFQQSGIDYFVTGKLHWNDTTKFSYGAFWWQSPDGTKLLTVMSPPNVAGVMDTNPIPMANHAINWECQTGFSDIFWLPGVGDHGGGPTRDMLEVQQRWRQSPFFPKLQFTTALDYLSAIHQQVTDRGAVDELPTWTDELYLEFHRGCYTTHADQKYFNRRCEGLLYQAELWASLATIILDNTNFSYPKIELEEAWKKVLFNQFHDILPGTSITEVFTEANRAWREVETTTQEIITNSLKAIASQIALPKPPHPDAQPVIIFNALNRQRSEVVSCPIPGDNWAIYDLQGQELITQLSDDNRLLFLAKDIPSVGYQLFWLCPTSQTRVKNYIPDNDREFIIDNTLLRVIVNPETGDLDSIFDKINQREILKGAGNQLQAFADSGQYWDAWNIDPNYANHPLPPTELKSIEYLESGPIQWRILVIRQLNNSEFCQNYILQVGSPILKINTQVNWQENHVLVKANFPLNWSSNRATYEIPFAAIERPIRPQNEAEQAKWEVPALRWADLTDTEQNYGISLLNDCKYGYDSSGDNLRLTLLRSPQWPDPTCDRGIHHFTYSIYPHASSWQVAGTVHRGYELNLPLQVLILEKNSGQLGLNLPPNNQLLGVSANNIIFSAFKQSESNPESWIIRCYECQGENAFFDLETSLKLAINSPVDFLENVREIEDGFSENIIFSWKIVSFQLKIANSSNYDNLA
jgi:alpha-mannosidase